MPGVTAYRCDVCNALAEDKPRYNYRFNGEKFVVEDYQSWSEHKCACDRICLKKAAMAWVKDVMATGEEL